MAIDESLKKLDKIFDQNIEITGTLTVGGSEIDFSSFLTSFTETDPIFSASAAAGITSTNITNWNTAYGWGNHADAGYLTSLPSHNHDGVYQPLNTTLSRFSESNWAGGGSYPGYTFSGGNTRFGLSSTAGVVDLYIDGNFYATDSSHLVIHAGNIGSQSVSYASNAGTLDSLDSTEFARGRAAWQQLNFDSFKQPGLYQYDSIAAGGGTAPPDPSPYNFRTIEIGSANRYSQIALGYNTDSMYLRRNLDGNWSTWRTVIHDGNVGSYAPGLNGSYNNDWYASSVYYDDWVRNHSNTNGLYWSTTGWHLHPYNSNDFTLRSGSSVESTIRFANSGNTTWGYIHCDANKTTGFLNDSRSWVSYTTSSGNHYATGSSRAPIFYDSNDTGYYVDPNGTSNLNGLNVGGYEVNSNSYRSRYRRGFYVAGTADKFYKVKIPVDSVDRLRVYRYYAWTIGGTSSYWNNGSSTHFGALNFVVDTLRNDWGGHRSMMSGYLQHNYTTVMGRALIGQGSEYGYAIVYLRGGAGGSGAYYRVEAESVHIGEPIIDYNSYITAADDDFNYNYANREINIHGTYPFIHYAENSHRSPIFYDSNDTNYYCNPNSDSLFKQLRCDNASSGWSAMLGAYDVSRTYNDANRHGLVINAGYYPHIDLNATATSDTNGTHGAVISMTGKLGSGFRRWGMGIAQYNPNELSFGYADNQTNPHYGVGINWASSAKMWIDTGGHLHSTGSMRSPIFYDRNDTNYYLDPAGTSTIRKTNIVASGSGWYDGLNLISSDGSTTWNFLVDDGAGDMLRVAYGGTERFRIQTDGEVFTVGTGKAGSDYRAPIFYDSNNTGYYVNPDSTSVLYDLAIGNGSSGNQKIEIRYGNYGSGYGAIRFYQSGSNHNTIHSFSGNWQNGIFPGESANAINITGGSGVTFGGWNNPDAWIDTSGNISARVNMFASTFYDRDNTGYYCNPAGNSNFNEAGFDGTVNFTKSTYPVFVYSYGNTGSVAAQGLQVYSSGNNGAIMSFHKGGYYAVNMGLDSDGVFRIGGWSASANRLQMDMSGNLTMAGDILAYSDARVKENIKTIDNALDKVRKARGVYYNRTDSEDKSTKIGVIAQEMLEVVPEVVNQDNDGMYNVSYGNITALLIEAVKELSNKVEDLENQLKQKS